jgi:hypothetical protein
LPPRHFRIEQSPLERGRLWVEIAALVAAGCWAVYTFVFQTRIAPLFVPPHEVVSLDAQRLAETPANYLERIEVTLHNDGYVDVDTAALAVAVFGARAGKELALSSTATQSEAAYRQVRKSAWTPLGGYGLLLAGAIAGHPHQHFILRPGDTATEQQLVVVPKAYSVLLVKLETIFDRYPITPRVDVHLQNTNGAISLKSKGISIGRESYFGV